MRKEKTPVRVGSVVVGGNAPVSVQAMTKTDTRDFEATLAQICSLVKEGAEIIRVAIPDEESCRVLRRLKREVEVPLVADVHFAPKLGFKALEAGADKIRVNPGNIGGKNALLELAKEARRRGAAIRIGVNSGSVEREILARHGRPSAEAMVESALGHVRFLEDHGVDGIVISLKSSSAWETVRAYRLIHEKTSWPLHVGVTEAGPGLSGVVKSAAGIGTLLAEGIGDTVRVSLSAPPEEEVKVARDILQSLELRTFGPDVIACPTCSRCQVQDLPDVAIRVKKALEGVREPLKVAVMGCPVNGPGEAREADVGIACGREGGILFRRGEARGRVKREEMVEALLALCREEIEARRRGDAR
ncbi:MAG TPA: flavodoxin-dependent (E)-4-hydroxy-3-methylbut-2-enyl-diphosphate synthase [Firmicutes bacterium]|nr:flavodoxin-dependent (E)-4-hydroxy-3-methylbut-2-enyl-diphosphate synthase [Candidatus Fermentithermobacillaceae bacterium]